MRKKRNRFFQSAQWISPKKERKESNNKIDRHGHTIDRFQLTSVGRSVGEGAVRGEPQSLFKTGYAHGGVPFPRLFPPLFPTNDSLINREPRVPQAETTVGPRELSIASTWK